MAAGFKQATVNSARVPATQTDFPVYVDLARLGITTLAEAQSVRVYADSGKATEWAREIVSATEMHVKVPSMTSTTTIYVDYDGVRADYAATDTFGRNNVWSDYLTVHHKQSNSTSSTGNFDGTDTSVTYVAGKVGNAGDYDGSSSKTDLSTGAMPSGSNVFTTQMWMRTDTTDFDTLWSIGATSGTRVRLLVHVHFSSTGFMYLDLASATGTLDNNVVSTSTWYLVHVTYAGGATNSNLKLYLNGSNQTLNYTGSGTMNITNSNQGYGYDRAFNTRFFNGLIDEFRSRGAALSADWITTEYNNQNNESDFWGTWTDASGGGGGATPSRLAILGVGS